MKEKPLHYFLILSVSALLLLGAVSLVNLLVDPFSLYKIYERQGFNDTKPAVYNRIRLMKAYEASRFLPDSIVLGTSRTHLGMRPSHPGWADMYSRRYNLAFDGSTTKEMYAYLVHSNTKGTIRHVMLGLDTYHLTNAPASVRPDFDPSILSQDKGWLEWPRALAAGFKILTSIDTLKESWNTVHARPQPSWLSPDGQRLGDIFFHRPEEDFMTCGPRCYFDNVNKMEVRFKLEWKMPKNQGLRIQTGWRDTLDPVTSLGYIRKIISYCKAHNIKLQIFLTPSHAHQLELDALTGNWQSIKDGKRAIVNLVEKENRDIVIYDFSGYSSITTEALPPTGSRRELRYYWDSSHFKDTVGDMILDRLLGSSVSPAIPDDFGVRLTSKNVGGVVSQLDQGRIAYENSHREEITILKEYITVFENDNDIAD